MEERQTQRVWRRGSVEHLRTGALHTLRAVDCQTHQQHSLCRSSVVIMHPVSIPDAKRLMQSADIRVAVTHSTTLNCWRVRVAHTPTYYDNAGYACLFVNCNNL